MKKHKVINLGRVVVDDNSDPFEPDLEPEQQGHTPGPWELSRDAVPDGYVQITVYAESTGVRVATAFEAEANADLIAAAPDLLAALKAALATAQVRSDLTERMHGYPTKESWVPIAREAVAKATRTK